MSSDGGNIDSPGTIFDGITSSDKSTKASNRSGGRRTHRACDRCRIKKSKCNGQQPCNTCESNERTCVFSALRRRDIRKWHCHMQDTVDEAIQRLYRACKECSNFPGVLPDEQNGHASTESILRAMGFSNLELGPKTDRNSAASRYTVQPPRTQFHGVPLSVDMDPQQKNGSNTMAAYSTPHTGLPSSDTSFPLLLAPLGPYQQVSPAPPLVMYEPFHEPINRLSVQHSYHQPTTHFNPNELQSSNPHPHPYTQPFGPQIHSVSPCVSDYRQHALHYADFNYGAEPCANPTQIWSERRSTCR